RDDGTKERTLHPGIITSRLWWNGDRRLLACGDAGDALGSCAGRVSGFRFCARLARSGPTLPLRGGHAFARLCTHGTALGGYANGAPALAPLVSQAIEDRDRFVELRFIRPEIRQNFSHVHSSTSIWQGGVQKQVPGIF